MSPHPCFLDHLFLSFPFCQVPRRNFFLESDICSHMSGQTSYGQGCLFSVFSWTMCVRQVAFRSTRWNLWSLSMQCFLTIHVPVILHIFSIKTSNDAWGAIGNMKFPLILLSARAVWPCVLRDGDKWKISRKRWEICFSFPLHHDVSFPDSTRVWCTTEEF